MDDVREQNKRSWDAMADSWFGTTALPAYGCYIPTEERLKLFPDLRGKRGLDDAFTVSFGSVSGQPAGQAAHGLRAQDPERVGFPCV